MAEVVKLLNGDIIREGYIVPSMVRLMYQLKSVLKYREDYVEK